AGEIDLLKQWIAKGAAWSATVGKARKPEKKISDADRAWWSFQPVKEPAVPPADAQSRNEIDRFIHARLKAEGLVPAPEADRRTGCACCHDHKFGPILHRDHFVLQSFYAGLLWRDDVPLAAPAELAEHTRKRQAWEAKTAALRAEIAAIEKPFLDNADRAIL